MSDIPAGWQPDPRGRHEYRYWDGSQWTDHVSDQGEVSQDPVAETGAPAADTPAPAAADPAPTEVHETPAADPAPDPVVAEPDPVVVEPDPVIAEPDPVVAEPDPGPVATPEPVVSEPAPTAATTPASSGPPTSSATVPPGQTAVPASGQTEAKAAAQDMLHSKSPELATILSVIAPGSGHFYMGASNAVPVGVGLLAATVVAVVLAYMSFILFIVGLVIWIGAAAFALNDLRGGVKGIEDTTLPPSTVGVLLIGAGVLLVVSLFLPWYHIKFDAGGFGSISGNANGWESLGIIDIVLLAVGVASIVAGAASLGLGPVTPAELPRQLPLIVAIGGAVAAALIAFRMIVDVVPGVPGGANVDAKVGRAPGILLAMDMALVLLIANAGILRSAANRR
ncbi:MAG: hypothetical protein QOI80_2955 [Solirubrobacteraceae bacterium]|jgi:hypothetical protein|nr:hypothetical protein [Solirubrobacteraceae bacterium]